MEIRFFHSNPDIMGGTPVFFGTRVPVKNLFDYLETGETVDRFVSDFETVKKEQVLGVLELSKEMVVTAKPFVA